jgi:hypothetical protein
MKNVHTRNVSNSWPIQEENVVRVENMMDVAGSHYLLAQLKGICVSGQA